MNFKMYKGVGIFQGKNGSLGFKTDQIYNIDLYFYLDGSILIFSDRLNCEYESLNGFQNNWKNVKLTVPLEMIKENIFIK